MFGDPIIDAFGLPPLPKGAVRDDENYSLGTDGACWLRVGGRLKCALECVALPGVLKRTWTLTGGSIRSLDGTYVGATKDGEWIVVKDVGTETGKTGTETFKKLARESLSQFDKKYVELATRHDADGTPVMPFDGTTTAPLPTGKGRVPLPAGFTPIEDSAPDVPAGQPSPSKPIRFPSTPAGESPAPKWEDSVPPYIPSGLSETERENWTQAVQGNAQAQAHVGWMYDTGTGVSQNFTEAAKWYRKAADQGNAEAQNHLGCLYWNGSGTPKNATEAGQWWQKAAAQGNAEAKQNLALMSAQQGSVAASDSSGVADREKPQSPDDSAALVVGYVILGSVVAILIALFLALFRFAKGHPKPQPAQSPTQQSSEAVRDPAPPSLPANGQTQKSATGARLLKTVGKTLLLYAGGWAVLMCLGGWPLVLKALVFIPGFVVYGLIRHRMEKDRLKAAGLSEKQLDEALQQAKRQTPPSQQGSVPPALPVVAPVGHAAASGLNARKDPSMNKKQRVVLVLGVSAFILVGLSNLDHGFSHDNYRTHERTLDVGAVVFLLGAWAMVAGATAGLFFVVKD